MDPMDFLKNVSNGIVKAAEATAKKAGELTDTAKLKLKQSRITGDITDAYTDIGKMIYQQYKNASDESEAIAGKCIFIDKCNREIAELDAQIEAIKKAAEAAKTEAGVNASEDTAEEAAQEEAADKTAAEPSENEQPEPENIDDVYTTTVRVCPACGAELSDDALYCSKCGQKQE